MNVRWDTKEIREFRRYIFSEYKEVKEGDDGWVIDKMGFLRKIWDLALGRITHGSLSLESKVPEQ